jgi:putative flippase GtrA
VDRPGEVNALRFPKAIAITTAYTRRVDLGPGLSLFSRQRYEALLHLNGTRRLVRFGASGLATFVVQIGMLLLLKSAGLSGVIANAIGIAVAVQFNFLISEIFVWSDRRLMTILGRQMVQRWMTFQSVIALSLVLNFGGFLIARLFVPDLPAAVFGIAASTMVKFLSLDRLAFRQS